MSKLFDTLEQIRHHESHLVSGQTLKNQTKGTDKAGPNKALLLLVILTAGFAAIYFSLPMLTGKKPASTGTADFVPADTAVTVSPPAPEVAHSLPAAVLFADDLVNLNNTGVRHVENNDQWQGILVFSQILTQNPSRIEPLINIGVALAELGLIEPAKRYLHQAAIIDRNHPALQENLTILKKAGMLGEGFFETGLTSGERL